MSVLIDDLKGRGMNAAIIRKDGVVVEANFNMKEKDGKIIASLYAVQDALLKEVKENAEEIRFTLKDRQVVVVSKSENLIMCFVKNKEELEIFKNVLKAAKKIPSK